MHGKGKSNKIKQKAELAGEQKDPERIALAHERHQQNINKSEEIKEVV